MHAAVAKRTLSFCWMNPLAGFGGWTARNCSETPILSSRNCSAHCTVLDASVLSKWNHECRSYIGSAHCTHVSMFTKCVSKVAPRNVMDVSMVTKWSHECRSCIAFFISNVAPRIVLDVLIVNNFVIIYTLRSASQGCSAHCTGRFKNATHTKTQTNTQTQTQRHKQKDTNTQKDKHKQTQTHTHKHNQTNTKTQTNTNTLDWRDKKKQRMHWQPFGPECGQVFLAKKEVGSHPFEKFMRI